MHLNELGEVVDNRVDDDPEVIGLVVLVSDKRTLATSSRLTRLSCFCIDIVNIVNAGSPRF